MQVECLQALLLLIKGVWREALAMAWTIPSSTDFAKKKKILYNSQTI